MAGPAIGCPGISGRQRPTVDAEFELPRLFPGSALEAREVAYSAVYLHDSAVRVARDIRMALRAFRISLLLRLV